MFVTEEQDTVSIFMYPLNASETKRRYPRSPGER
jgi:hypothetical protein